jgi:hypothetical protein
MPESVAESTSRTITRELTLDAASFYVSKSSFTKTNPISSPLLQSDCSFACLSAALNNDRSTKFLFPQKLLRRRCNSVLWAVPSAWAVPEVPLTPRTSVHRASWACMLPSKRATLTCLSLVYFRILEQPPQRYKTADNAL